MKIKEIEREIKKVHERNKRVESDKAWELSLTRKAVISVFTYLVVVFWLWTIKVPDPWLNAAIPAIAFILSTLTLPILKKYWINNVYKK